MEHNYFPFLNEGQRGEEEEKVRRVERKKERGPHRRYGVEVAKFAVDAVYTECCANLEKSGNFKCNVRQVWRQLLQTGHDLPCSTLYDIYKRVLKAHADEDRDLSGWVKIITLNISLRFFYNCFCERWQAPHSLILPPCFLTDIWSI